MIDVCLVFGSRTWTDFQTIARALIPTPELLIEGECVGADLIARFIHEYRGGLVQPFPADWARYGAAAGPIRNQEQLDQGRPTRAEGFIVGHIGSPWGRGSGDMARRAFKYGIPVRIWRDGGVLEVDYRPLLTLT